MVLSLYTFEITLRHVGYTIMIITWECESVLQGIHEVGM